MSIGRHGLFNRVVMFFFFHLVLRRLIRINYESRYQSAIKMDGEYKDEWYWADMLACEYGYFVDEMPHKIRARYSARSMNCIVKQFKVGKQQDRGKQ